jgi:DNA-binding CsgD family transcriptional regulator
MDRPLASRTILLLEDQPLIAPRSSACFCRRSGLVVATRTHREANCLIESDSFPATPFAGLLTAPPILGPGALNKLQNGFDAAWEGIAGNFSYENVDAARSKLAAFLIDLAQAGRLAANEFALAASPSPASRSTAASRVANLTTRQRQILELVLAGHPSKNIAADLGISQRTDDNHRAAIMRKTDSKSLASLFRTVLAAA